MSTKKVRQILAAVLSIVMILSLMVVPAGAARPMGGEAVAETPADAETAEGGLAETPAATQPASDAGSGTGDPTNPGIEEPGAGEETPAASWDFQTDAAFTNDAYGYAANTAGKDFKGLTLGAGTGYHNGYCYMNNGHTVTIPVTGKCNVEVTTQHGAVATVGVGEDKVNLKTNGSTAVTTTYRYKTEAAGNVTIAATGTTYLCKIEIKAFNDTLKGEVDDSWVFTGNTAFDATEYAFASNTAGKTFQGLTLGAGTGYHNNYCYMNNTHTVTVPVAGKCNVEVTTQHGAAGTVGVGEDTVDLLTDGTNAITTVYHYGTEEAGNVTIAATATTYLSKIEIKEYSDPAPAITVTPVGATVTMASKTDTTVTAQTAEVAINYANTTAADMSTVVAAVPEADADIVTAAVSADKTKVTLTPGTKAGKTTVTVTATPTDSSAEALTAEITVTNVDPDATPTEWIFGGTDGTHSKDTFATDSRGLKISDLKAVNYHNSYGVLAKPVKNETTQEVIPATIGIPVPGPCKITVTVGYTWDMMLGDAQVADRYGRETCADLGGNNGSEQAKVFNYYGSEGYVTLTAMDTTSTYIYSIKVDELGADDNVATTPKVAVWDLMGTQLDETMYDNRLDVETIKGFYGDPIPNPPTLGAFATVDGEFAFMAEPKGEGIRDDYRLRTAKAELTGFVHSTNNYTKNDVAKGDDPYAPTLTTYDGSFQSNGGKMTFQFKANAGDKLTFTYADASTSGATVNMNYIEQGAAEGTATKTLGKVGTGNGSVASVYVATTGVHTFTNALKEDGTWSKVGVARFYRETPTKVTVSGALSVASDVPETYKLILTDDVSGVTYEADTTTEAGKWSAEVNNYLSGTSFTLSVTDAEGCIVGSGEKVEVPAGVKTVANCDVAIVKVDLATVSGSVTGLDAADLANLVIDVALPSNSDKVYVPKIIPAADGTYTAQLEKGVTYTLSAKNVNDYNLTTTSLSKDADATDVAIAFTKKGVQDVTVSVLPEGTTVDLSAAKFTFTKLDDADKSKPETDDKHPDGYVYTFTGATGIKLRDGQYKVKLDGAPLPNKLIADVKVAGAAATLPITFVTNPYVPADTHTFASIKDDSFNSAVVGITFTDFSAHTGGHGPTGAANASVKLNLEKAATVTITTCCYGLGNDLTASAGTVATADGTEYKEDSATHVKTYAKVFTITDVPAGEATFTFGSTVYVHSIQVQYVSPLITEDVTLTVGTDKQFQTIGDAVKAVEEMNRADGVRATIVIDPANYEEMVWVKSPNVTFKNASETPSIALTNQGKDIDTANAVRITWYYGCGFDYYSMGANSKFDAEQLAINKSNGYVSHPNSAGGGSNNECWWNATTVIAAEGFQAEGIIFENSFNQYVSAAAARDKIVPNGGAKEDSSKPRAGLAEGSTDVQRKAYVERAAAIALANDKADKAFFDNCAFVGHQDVIYGGRGVNAGFYDCDVFGACDYVFGPMTAVFAKCDMVLNVGADADANDVAYITAPQNGADVHGYLMYNCNVRSVVPGTENAGTELTAVQHEFGRAWGGATAEAVFYETTVGVNKNGKSLISPAGWNTGLGSSQICAEYHTHETAADADHTKRIFGGILAAPKTTAGAALSDYVGWMGGWDPFEGKNMAIDCPEKDAASGISLKDGANAAEAKYTLELGSTKTLTVAVEPAAADQSFAVSGVNEAVSVTQGENNTFIISADDLTTEDVTLTVSSTAATADGTAATATVAIQVVPVRATGITLNDGEAAAQDAYTLKVGETKDLTVAVAPENAVQDFEVTGATEAVTVTKGEGDNANKITITGVAVTEADVTITVTSVAKDTTDQAKTDTVTIKVVPVAVETVTVKGPNDATSSEIVVGDAEQTLQLTATVAPENATVKTVKWSSSSDTVTVDPDTGLVTIPAKDQGVEGNTVTITATSDGKDANGNAVTGTYEINTHLAYMNVDKVEVTADAAEVAQGGTVQLTATVMPALADQNVTWSSSSEKVTVDENGLVTVDADAPAGKVTITATSVGKDANGEVVTGTIELEVVSPADALQAAVDAAFKELENTLVSEDGTDVSKNSVWTTAAEREKLEGPEGALEAVKSVVEDENATPEAKLKALDRVNAALAAFKAAQKPGTKANRRPSAIGTTTKPDTTKTESSTNDKGDVATTVTNADGKTITVVNKDGETVAEVKLPATIPSGKTKFKDVPEGHWAEDAIDHMAGLGMVQGVNEAHDLFDMDSTMTRASIATMFFRLSSGAEGITSTFEDVPAGQWYTDAIGWAAKTGVVNGYSETAFGPDDTITRQQLAVMLQRYANLIGMDVKAHASALDPFADGDKADEWAVDGLAWCVKNGIMKGRGGDVLDPTAPISRVEATAMFDRVIALMQK